MLASVRFSAFSVLVALAGLFSLGCEREEPQAPASRRSAEPPTKQSEVKRVLLGRNIWLEVDGEKRRVLVACEVCLRQGLLEQFLCRKMTKEHEAVLAADIDARQLHAALEAAGAKAGSTVRFAPRYQPATGSKVKVSVRYTDKDGKEVTVPAQKWVRNVLTKKDLEHDWVFGGSRLVPNRLNANEPPYYLANDGDVISVSNFETSLMDLPINSPKDNASLQFEIHTERVPEVGTKVTLILDPVPESKQ